MAGIKNHKCRQDCGACCIAPSISSVISGMEIGKPAGVRCIHLTDDYLCDIFNSTKRPQVCVNFIFDPVICGNKKEEAMQIMKDLEHK